MDLQTPRLEALSATSNSVQRVKRRKGGGGVKDTGTQPTSLTQSSNNSEQGSQQGSGILHTFENLPEYLQDNEFILGGYRYNLPVKDTLKSFWGWHNETGNIWSHFLGFCLFVYITIWVVRSPPAPLTVAAPQLEVLWGRVREHVHHLSESVEDNLHHIHDSLPRLPHLQALHDVLSHGLSDSVHSVQDSVRALQDSLHTSVTVLHEKMHNQTTALAASLAASPFIASIMAEGSAAREAILARQHQVHLSVQDLMHWPVDRWPVYVFCSGAMLCLLMSSFCHLFGCCERHIALSIWRLDYTGIALLIVASFYPPVYYGFMCHPWWAAAYLSLITCLGLCCVAVSLISRFQTPDWRATRAGMFVGLGLLGIIPILHQLALNSDVWQVRAAVARILLMGATYIAGAGFFVARIPERWYPGRFDMFFHSHQIFHLAVIAGAYIHWRAVLLLLEWRDTSGGCAVPLSEGPLATVLHELRGLSHDLLHIDQIWSGLQKYTSEHFLHHSPSSHPGSH